MSATKNFSNNDTVATVNVLTYNVDIQEWEPIAEDAPLVLRFNSNSQIYNLSVESEDGNCCINDNLDSPFFFKFAAEEFYNYRLGEGPIYGFQFLDNLGEFSKEIEKVLDMIGDPSKFEESEIEENVVDNTTSNEVENDKSTNNNVLSELHSKMENKINETIVPGISSEDMELFKSTLIEDFKAELNVIKMNIINSIKEEMAK